MTVSSTVNRVGYTGNDVTVNFSTSFPYLLAADVKVYLDGVLKTLTTHYTLSGGSGVSGNVTFLAAPAAGKSIVIIRDPAQTQELDLVENDPLPAEELEKAFDKLTMLVQRQSDLTNRALTLADSETTAVSTQMPVAEAGKLLGWAADGLSIVSTSASAVGAGSIDTTELADDAVTADKIATDAVTADAIAALAVGTSELAAGAATLAKLDTTGALNSVLTGQGAGSAPAWAAIAIPMIRGSHKNLKIAYTGTSAAVTFTADEIVVASDAGAATKLSGVSQAANTGGAAGADSLDTGSWAYSTQYYVHLIYNPTTAGKALLFSLSATAPTLPAGYTQFARVGANFTQSGTNYYLLGGTQYGSLFKYKVTGGSNVAAMRLMASGASGSLSTPTWVAVAVGAFVPATAHSIIIVANGAGGNGVMVAPNNAYGAITSTSNPPPVATYSGSASYNNDFYAHIMLESTNIYWACTAGYLYAAGWEDML